MWFPSDTLPEKVSAWAVRQFNIAASASKLGVECDIRPRRNRHRTNEQNRFLMAILVASVRFYQETGFMPSGLSPWAMRTDILKEYWKARLGVASTAKLDTAAFAAFTDGIQRSLVEETHGQWEVLDPDSAYVRALVEQGGL